MSPSRLDRAIVLAETREHLSQDIRSIFSNTGKPKLFDTIWIGYSSLRVESRKKREMRCRAIWARRKRERRCNDKYTTIAIVM